jgi:hypothetical protein
LWWVEPQKAQRLDQAMRDRSVKIDVPPVEDHYWQEYGRDPKHQLGTGQTQ